MIEIELFLESTLITFLVSIAGCLLGIPLGLLVAVLRLKKVPLVSPLLAVYVSFVRSLPLVLFVMLFYYGVPILGLNLDSYTAGILALALNNASFTSEIWRAALVDFSIDQLEAARAYGMNRQQAFWRIMFPQVWRSSIPPITSEITLLVKSSPALGIIGINELTRRSSILAASNYQPVLMLLIATLIYMVVILAFAQLSRSLDQRLQSQYELV
ncbi:MAG: amino acid ABC transporter permease [Oculatellaceae cyanobacterium Prado106]|nr:amino acid ABC transporter permease [Oculatellaceae cyanobacterium Prado106]